MELKQQWLITSVIALLSLFIMVWANMYSPTTNDEAVKTVMQGHQLLQIDDHWYEFG